MGLKAVGAITAAPFLLIGGLLLTVTVGAAGNPAAATAGCGTGGGTPVSVSASDLPAQAVDGYAEVQLQNAALIVAAGAALGLDAHTQTLAVMAAAGESGLIVADHGDAAGPDSRGLFQQRDNGQWGSYADRMDPTTSATNFFHALLAVPDYETLPPSLAAHIAQGNSDPYYYAPFWQPAQDVVAALAAAHTTVGATTVSALSPAPTAATPATTPVATSAAPPADAPPAGAAPSAGQGDGGESTCGAGGVTDVSDVNATGWANPLPGAVITQPFGGPGNHPGIDLAAPEGTPLLAAHAGTVVFAGPASGYGDHYVCVDSSQPTGAGGPDLVACYGHGEAQLVQVGDTVAAGQPVALEGCEGDCTGPHLHFEIRAGLWGQVSDPYAFMAARGIALGDGTAPTEFPGAPVVTIAAVPSATPTAAATPTSATSSPSRANAPKKTASPRRTT